VDLVEKSTLKPRIGHRVAKEVLYVWTAPRSTLDYLDDILDAVDKIEIFTRGMSYEEFLEGDKTVYAVTRALEVIGEANVSPARSERTTLSIPGVRWLACATN